MCFSIPLKVLKVEKETAIVEGGKNIKIDRNLKLKKGEYLQVIGEIAVGKLTNNEGLKVRRLIKSLNS